MPDQEKKFSEIFIQATGQKSGAFPYQRSLAISEEFPSLLEAPTGAGKTAAVILAWIWRRLFASEAIRKKTPRRLIYCLPMRVLVEQTFYCALRWLKNLNCLDGEAEFDSEGRIINYEAPTWKDPSKIAVIVLMGGEERYDWDLYPERNMILIGTQDMLISRALNRGYGMSRYRWPMHFGLLNNDCLWVFDEIQLMDSGLATTAQVTAFRQKFGTYGICQSLWMSATLRSDWLNTFDFRETLKSLKSLKLSEEDRVSLKNRLEAKKCLEQALLKDKPILAGDDKIVAEFVKEKHIQNSLSLLVVNTVARAINVYTSLQELFHPKRKRNSKSKTESISEEKIPEILLIHSHFRRFEREEKMQQILSTYARKKNCIVISTQIIEAGVDFSSRTLITELAPWPSLIQRFGRCNRFGEFSEGANIYWIDIPPSSSRNKTELPYSVEEINVSRRELKKLSEVSINAIDNHLNTLTETEKKILFPYAPNYLIRKKDMLDLFDTTPDLAGFDVDISRFIREGEELDAQVFWREVSKGSVPEYVNPNRQEFCPVAFYKLREFASKKRIFYWDFLDRKWNRVTSDKIFPGQLYLIAADSGGYSSEIGWNENSNESVKSYQHPPKTTPKQDSIYHNMLLESYDDDLYALEQKNWKTIAEHSHEIVEELKQILSDLKIEAIHPFHETLILSARWHDRGKAHPVFQNILPTENRPQKGDNLWAKSPQKEKISPLKYERTGFRHELASALALLEANKDDLACYLAIAHHGKVRLSIRSLPHEKAPTEDPNRLFARGVWDQDKLPKTDLGDNQIAPEVTLSLKVMNLGSENEILSWTERVLNLRNEFGPFRLAYLETLIRAADMRVSRI